MRRRKRVQLDREIKGINNLRSVAAELSDEKGRHTSYIPAANDVKITGKISPAVPADPIDSMIQRNGRARAIFFTGQGGGGKTVVSCATAVHLASRGVRILLLTTYPASHIGQVLVQALDDQIQAVKGEGNLYAAVIDQRRATAEYKQRIIGEAEGKYSRI